MYTPINPDFISTIQKWGLRGVGACFCDGFWSDCANVQAGLNFRWARMSDGAFSAFEANLLFFFLYYLCQDEGRPHPGWFKEEVVLWPMSVWHRAWSYVEWCPVFGQCQKSYQQPCEREGRLTETVWSSSDFIVNWCFVEFHSSWCGNSMVPTVRPGKVEYPLMQLCQVYNRWGPPACTCSLVPLKKSEFSLVLQIKVFAIVGPGEWMSFDVSPVDCR